MESDVQLPVKMVDVHRRDALLRAIADSYHRMATNIAPKYRVQQRKMCEGWLKELTELYKKSPGLMTFDPGDAP